jgi:hypothetical protein
MRRIISLFRKDLALGFQDVFILLEIGFAVVLVLLLLFVVPEEIDTEGVVFIHDETRVLERFVESIAPGAAEELGEFMVGSRDAVVAGMEEHRSALGVVLSGQADGSYEVELLRQPYTPQSLVDYIEVELSDLFAVLAPAGGGYPPDVYNSVRVTGLQEGLRDEIPFNRMLMPSVLLFMVGILGLFIMVSLVGQERVDQTLRALRVSPSSLWQFLISKHLVVLFTGLITFTILYVPMMGVSGFPASLMLIVLTIVMGSSLGTFLASFVADPMEGIGWIVLFWLVLGLPAVSLFSPVFSPWWLKVIPSYHTLFGLDAAMFPDNNAHIVRDSAWALAGFSAVLFALSGVVFTTRIRKEA